VSKVVNRSDPQFFSVYEMDWRHGTGPDIIGGLNTRALSQDADSGSSTYMAQLPAGWKFNEEADEATIEMFVLEGDITANGQRVGAGGFVAIPKHCGPCELSSEAGAQVYLWWTPIWPDGYYYDSAVYVAKVWQLPWVASEMPGIQHGIMHKSLRVPDPAGGAEHGGPAGLLRFIIQVPGFHDHRQEFHHACWEEIIWLSGDFLMPERGFCGPGTYLSNPPDHVHGVMMTQRGNIELIHTSTPIGVEFSPYPSGEELTAHYLDSTSWLEDPLAKTEEWKNRPEYQDFMLSRPDYQAWLDTGAEQVRA
jgi:hypothetical protein